MAEDQIDLHLDSIEYGIASIIESQSALHHSFSKLLSSCQENTLLLRQILDLLPNPKQKFDEPEAVRAQVFDEMPKRVNTVTTEIEPSHEASYIEDKVFEENSDNVSGMASSEILSCILKDNGDLEGNVVGAEVFDEMLERTKDTVSGETIGVDVKKIIKVVNSGSVKIVLEYSRFSQAFPQMSHENVYSKECVNMNEIVDVNDPYKFRLLVMGDDRMVVVENGDLIESSITQEQSLKLYDKNLGVGVDGQSFAMLVRTFNSNGNELEMISMNSMLLILLMMQTTHGFDKRMSFDPGILKNFLNPIKMTQNRLSDAFVQNDKMSIEDLKNDGLFTTNCVDSTEQNIEVRLPHNLLESINLYYGFSFGEYIAQVILKYFDPGGRITLKDPCFVAHESFWLDRLDENYVLDNQTLDASYLLQMRAHGFSGSEEIIFDEPDVIWKFYTMEDTKSVAALIDSTTTKTHQLQKAFAKLESQCVVTLNLKWKELEEQFRDLEKSLKRRFYELEDQEREFNTKTRKSQEMLLKCEAVAVAKEQTSLSRLQEKRDTAVFSTTNSLEKHIKLSSADINCDCNSGELSVEEKPDSVVTENNSENIKSSFENGNFEVKFYPQLVKLCEEMESHGLQKFLSDHRKNPAGPKEEILWTLTTTTSPGRLVLESLGRFYFSELPNVDGKKDSNLLGYRCTCIMLLHMCLTKFSYFTWFHENLMIDVTCGVERSCRPMLLRILIMYDPFEIPFCSILADKDCFKRVGIVMS